MTEHDHSELSARVTDLVGEVRAGRVEQRIDHAKVREDIGKLQETTMELGSDVRQLSSKLNQVADLANTTASTLSAHLHEHEKEASFSDGQDSVWKKLARPVYKAAESLDKVLIILVALGGGAVGAIIGLAQ